MDRWIQERDRLQFNAVGYMVIRNVVPETMTINAVREIAALVGADLADSSTWYASAPELDGVVPLHHAQSLWDIRQFPDLYEVFSEFFGTGRLMVDINRCIFRPPSIRGARRSAREVCLRFTRTWRLGWNGTRAIRI